MYYYVCRYSWKYCSEIMYALEQIDLSAFPSYNILSIGCGGAPDLMAFEEIRPAWDTREIFYKGYDINPRWNPIHNAIEQYATRCKYLTANFKNKNIFDVLKEGKPSNRNYNVVILEYLISHFPVSNRSDLADTLFDGLLENVLPNRLSPSPFLFIINDIDHFSVRDCFINLIEKLYDDGYDFECYRRHFKGRSQDFDDGSVQYNDARNRFIIPNKIKDAFDCAITCSSAQLIVEVK